MPAGGAAALIAAMAPVRRAGAFVFCATAGPAVEGTIASFHEAEGLSLILPLDAARRHGFDTALPMAQITLSVQSSLADTGLTAAVSGALAEAGIPCNMVAAFHHDHVFVPEALADRALAVLMDLQRSAAT